MSSANKTKRKNQQTSKNYSANALENTVDKTDTSDLAKNKSKNENIPKKRELIELVTPKNLMTVRQASFSSEDGKSKKKSASQKSKQKNHKQKSQRSKQQKFENRAQQTDKKIPQNSYDQYNVLKISGLLDAYEHFLKLLCKHGLPTGKIYDYAAQEILKYEKKKINRELKMRAQLDIQKILKKNEKGSPSPQRLRQASPYYQH